MATSTEFDRGFDQFGDAYVAVFAVLVSWPGECVEDVAHEVCVSLERLLNVRLKEV